MWHAMIWHAIMWHVIHVTCNPCDIQFIPCDMQSMGHAIPVTCNLHVPCNIWALQSIYGVQSYASRPHVLIRHTVFGHFRRCLTPVTDISTNVYDAAKKYLLYMYNRRHDITGVEHDYSNQGTITRISSTLQQDLWKFPPEFPIDGFYIYIRQFRSPNSLADFRLLFVSSFPQRL